MGRGALLVEIYGDVNIAICAGLSPGRRAKNIGEDYLAPLNQ